MDILVIADTQIDKDSPLDHIEALSKYIWKHKPDTIIHGGDNWDFPSLSSYATPSDREGLRLVSDIESGLNGLKKVMAYTEDRNRTGKRKQYTPELHFLMGNHEKRLDKFIDGQPLLHGLIDLRGMIEELGWNFHEFNVPLWKNDICFVHYLESAFSGRPIGGAMETKLNKVPHSFFHFHQQQFQFARRQNRQGKPHFGICAGAFYMHDEKYRGSNNTEIRGVVHLRGFTNRYGYLDYDLEYISMERLLQDYS